ncbi:MAG: hypothetical protein HUU10_00930 [Bacteroidetes bacterium]|nr:hypothetical protein [Bacteroidota bacterium]
MAVLFCSEGFPQTIQVDEDALFDRSGQSALYEEESGDENWFNLNTASYSELIRWATPDGRASVDSIYRYRFLSPIRSEADLASIPGVDPVWASHLLWNQDGLCQLKTPGQTLLSHRTTSSGLSDQWTDYRQVTTIRSRFFQNWSAGMTAERDPGESRFADHLVGYVHYQSEKGWIRSVTLGHFRPRFGAGLAWGSAYPPMKSDQLLTVPQSWKTTIQPWSGSFEGAGAFGFASETGWKQWHLAMGLSHRRVDGYGYRLQDQPQNVFLHPDTDGLHVTETEIERRAKLIESIQFGWIGYQFSSGEIQIHAFRKEYQSGVATEKLQDISPVRKKGSLKPGNQTGWGGAFQHRAPGNHLAGEWLFSERQWSGTAAWLVQLPAGFRSMVMTRYLGVTEPSLYSGMLSEGNPLTGNEAGLYTGLDYRTVGWKAAVILDRWEQIYPDPGQNSRASGSDWIISGTFRTGKNSDCRLGMALSADKGPEPAERRKWKVSWKQSFGETNVVLFRWDFLKNVTQSKEGTAITIRLTTTPDSWWSAVSQMSWFVVNDATVRPFISDPEVPGLMVFRALYQKGVRYSALFTISEDPWPSVSVKWGLTRVTDVLNAGSSVKPGLSQDATIQIRWNF